MRVNLEKVRLIHVKPKYENASIKYPELSNKKLEKLFLLYILYFFNFHTGETRKQEEEEGIRRIIVIFFIKK